MPALLGAVYWKTPNSEEGTLSCGAKAEFLCKRGSGLSSYFLHRVPCSTMVGFLRTCSCQSAHGTWFLYSKPSFTPKLLYWGQRVPRVVGCACAQPPYQAATTNTHMHTHWVYHVPLPCLPASMCAFVVLFICNSCTPPPGWYVPSSSSLCKAERQDEYLSKNPTFLNVQICLHGCGNSSQGASVTLPSTHTDIYT